VARWRSELGFLAGPWRGGEGPIHPRSRKPHPLETKKMRNKKFQGVFEEERCSGPRPSATLNLEKKPDRNSGARSPAIPRPAAADLPPVAHPALEHGDAVGGVEARRLVPWAVWGTWEEGGAGGVYILHGEVSGVSRVRCEK